MYCLMTREGVMSGINDRLGIVFTSTKGTIFFEES
jgi:hypothetical protein